MSKVTNILAIVDPTAAEQPAVEKAAVLAEKFHARLELYVCDTRAAREARLARDRAKDPTRLLDVNLRPMLDKLAEPIRARGVDVTVESEYADVLHDGLLARTKRTSADLVVKDTHHHSLAKRTFITNTDWHLIRGCPVPLLLTKATKWSAQPKVVAAVDPGHVNDKPAALDVRILQHAAAVAKCLGGELHVAHAYLPLAIVAAATVGTPPMIATVPPEALNAEHETKLKELTALAKSYQSDPDKIHLDVASPTEFIPRIAETLSADIVAMGAIARSGLKRIFIGHTAENVLERLPCDALIVKPPNFDVDMSF
jgi:universal stress protein E